MRINWKWLLMESIILHIYVFHDLTNEIKVNDNYINLFVNVKAIDLQNC